MQPTEPFDLDAIQTILIGLLREDPKNRLPDGSAIYGEPLVGAATGDDPLFTAYKTIIGPFHMTPDEVFGGKAAEGLSVICWALPFSEAVRASNRRQKAEPSLFWAHARQHGEEVNDALRRGLVDALRASGHEAIAPAFHAGYKVYYEGVEHVPASTWSERHVLYAAGLGTFSLSDGFITPAGIAMRCGSVVTDLRLPPTPRPYESHTANCLYLAAGTCGKCIKRCPAGAITVRGHDKPKCRAYIYGDLTPLRETYGLQQVGCGLCQTAVPCEDRIPTEDDLQLAV